VPSSGTGRNQDGANKTKKTKKKGLDDPLVVCDEWEAVPSAQLSHLPGIEDFDHPAIDTLHFELDYPSGEPLPEGRWVVINIGGYRASFAALSPSGTYSRTVAFERQDGNNEWFRSGEAWEQPCGPRVPLMPGLGRVEVNLDPESLPTPDSTSITLLVTEEGCASGREMGDDLRGPQVSETEDAVLVAFAVIYKPGIATCPDNPAASVTIDLAEPLGDRTIYDGLFWRPSRVRQAQPNW